MATLLETRGITMAFGSLVANDHVNFKCEEGQVVSLLGENGAGKTTLMKVIYGMNHPQSGEIFFQGRKVVMRSPKDAIRLGIQMVHQHFMLVDHLSVAENVVMGNEPSKLGLFERAKAEAKVRELAELYGLSVDPRALVGDISVGEKQRVEIIKALYHGAKLLILDEPTAVLTPQEADELFKIIEKLKDDGRSIIIITHKLHETMRIADVVYIMRLGKMVGCLPKNETDPAQLTRLMVEHELIPFKKSACCPGENILEMRDVRLKGPEGNMVLNGIDLTVRSGEIFGIAGIEGNGQLELVETVSGIARGWSGEIELMGHTTRGMRVGDIIDLGVACIHPDRHDRGLLLGLDARNNILLGYQHTKAVKDRWGLLGKTSGAAMCKSIFQRYRVVPDDANALAGSFSGGNQQKLVVGREFYRKPKLAVVAYPTRGVDIGVSQIIHESIMELRASGSAILLITADFDELFKLSDRIGVLYEGQITTQGPASEYTPTRLGFYMGGGKRDEEV